MRQNSFCCGFGFLVKQTIRIGLETRREGDWIVQENKNNERTVKSRRAWPSEDIQRWSDDDSSN